MPEVWRLPVKAPDCCILHGRHPIWDEAYSDDMFDPNGYLHLPYGGGDYGDDYVVTRVFFDRRDYWQVLGRRKIAAYRLEKNTDTGMWEWVVTIGSKPDASEESK